MKRIVKAIAIILVLALVAPSVMAATIDPITPLGSAYLSSYTVYLTTSGNTINVHFHVSGMKVLEEIGARRIIIQRSTDQVNWITVSLIEHVMPGYENMIVSGKQFYSSSVPYTGISGYYYRAYVSIWGGDGTNGDVRFIFTPVKQL